MLPIKLRCVNVKWHLLVTNQSINSIMNTLWLVKNHRESSWFIGMVIRINRRCTHQWVFGCGVLAGHPEKKLSIPSLYVFLWMICNKIWSSQNYLCLTHLFIAASCKMSLRKTLVQNIDNQLIHGIATTKIFVFTKLFINTIFILIFFNDSVKHILRLVFRED